MGNEKNCTCNSRTVDDSWNLIHSDDCELNKQITMKRQLATEWLIDNISPDLRFALETIYNKAVIEQAKQKEIENLNDDLKNKPHADAKPVLWAGWISTEKELPSDEMDGEQVLMVLTYKSSEPLVICGYWEDGFYSLETGDYYDNVSHWAYLPTCP